MVLFGAPQAGVDESSKVAEDRILAVVDGSPITVDDLEAEMVRRGGAANFASREALGALLDEDAEGPYFRQGSARVRPPRSNDPLTPLSKPKAVENPS